jgi:hypothetical protein
MADPAPPRAPVRLLLAGPVRGAYGALLKRVSTVATKAAGGGGGTGGTGGGGSGPAFDALLCVGEFFAPGEDGGGEDSGVPAELQALLSSAGAAAAPDQPQQLPPNLPPIIAFCSPPTGRGAAATLAAIEAAGPGAPLRYLGSGAAAAGGGIAEVAGLSVAFLARAGAPPGGATGAAAVAADDAAAAAAAAARAAVEAHEGEVDLLLTCEWPAGVLLGLPPPEPAAAPDAAAAAAAPPPPPPPPGDLPPAIAAAAEAAFRGTGPAVGSPGPAALADLARPRYHIVPGDAAALRLRTAPPAVAAGDAAQGGDASAAAARGLWYARPPYASRDLGAGARATRFLALAPVGNAAKAKFLHALALVPAHALPPEQLAAVPAGATPSPYELLQQHVAQQQQQQQQQRGTKRPADAAAEAADGSAWRWQQRGVGGAGNDRNKRGRGPNEGAAPAAPGGGGGVVPWGAAGVVKDPSRTVFVRNLPPGVTYAQVEAFFASGTGVAVEDVRRFLQQQQAAAGGAEAGGGNGPPPNHNNNNHNSSVGARLHSWAHVQMATREGAAAALGLSGQQLNGRELTVEPANTPREPRAPGAAAAGGATTAPRRPPHPPRHAPAPSGQPVADCWFCLSSDRADPSLVASVGEEAYVALDKGPVPPPPPHGLGDHALVVPIEHYASLASMPPAAAAEAARFLAALRRRAEALEGGAAAAPEEGPRCLVGFERFVTLRGRGGNHCHVNAVSVPRARAGGAAEVFMSLAEQMGLPRETPAPEGEEEVEAEEQAAQQQQQGGEKEEDGAAAAAAAAKAAAAGEGGGGDGADAPPAAAAAAAAAATSARRPRPRFGWRAVPAGEGAAAGAPCPRALLEAVGGNPRREYFLALLPDGSGLVRPVAPGERVPMNLGRAALAELLGAPERAEWQACVLAPGDGPDGEAAAVAAFKASFAAFDPAAAAAAE